MNAAELPAAFAAKVRRTECLVWIGATNSKGYGLISVDGTLQLAHRVAYVAEFGPIPEGHVIDHLCRVRNCVNPMHLEAVTVGENNRRGRAAKALTVGDVCINGHVLSDGDIYKRPSGLTECRHCRYASSKRVDGVRPGRPTAQRRTERVASDLEQTERGAA